jgi:hypothetical protein
MLVFDGWHGELDKRCLSGRLAREFLNTCARMIIIIIHYATQVHRWPVGLALRYSTTNYFGLNRLPGYLRVPHIVY